MVRPRRNGGDGGGGCRARKKLQVPLTHTTSLLQYLQALQPAARILLSENLARRRTGSTTHAMIKQRSIKHPEVLSTPSLAMMIQCHDTRWLSP
jgi:hypothetical protein